VGQDQHGTPARRTEQIGHQRLRAGRVQALGGFVEDQQIRCGQQRPGGGQPFALTAGDGRAAGAQPGIQVPSGQADPLQHPRQLGVRGLRPREPEVLPHRGGEHVIGAVPDQHHRASEVDGPGPRREQTG
jgi:hypothetical protein